MIRFKKDDGSNYPDWEEKSFDDIFTMYQTNTFSRDQLNSECGETQNIHYGDILVKYGSVIDCNKDDIPYINNDVVLDKFKEDSYIQNGDIIIADTAEDYTAGKVSEVQNVDDRKILSGLHTMLCRPQTTFASKYLGYYLNSEQYHKQIVRLLVGTKVYSINKKAIVDTLLKYPCIEEQQKIADFLSSVDDVISASEKEITSLEEQKKGVMQKIFRGEVRFKADDGSDYPEWEERSLDSLFEYKNGNSFENALDENGQYFLISLNSIDREGNLQKELKRVNEAEWFLEKNDIVMVLSDVGKGNFLGLCDIIPCNNAYVLNQRMGLLRAKENLNYIFMRNYINYNQKYFKSQGQGSAQLNISKGDVLKFQVKCPCIEEQQKIADFLSDFDTAIEKAKEELECWKEIKKGLLQQLFE